MKKFFLKVLTKKQKEILKNLSFINKYNFYLTGGTALALQIGHRTSLDFDFFTEKNFNPQNLISEFEKKFKKVKTLELDKDTLILNVNNVKLSFFKYPYKLLFPLLNFNGIKLASIEDISATKIIALTQRGTKKDFIDIYFLIKKLGLKKILEFAQKKYPSFNIYLGLKALIYFEDVEKERKEKFKIFQKVSWYNIKRFLISEVRKFKNEK